MKRDELVPGNFDICVTNYESILSESRVFSKFIWRYLGKLLLCSWDSFQVIDEGHKIKNEKANLSMALRGIRCQMKLLLTGTPFQVAFFFQISLKFRRIISMNFGLFSTFYFLTFLKTVLTLIHALILPKVSTCNTQLNKI